jgi:hypothetical protein
MFKKTNCPIRAVIVYIVLMYTISISAHAQTKSAFDVGLLYGSSTLTFNQNSDKFDKRIVNEIINYSPVQNLGIALGYSVSLTERLALQMVPRWQQWGGIIDVQSSQNATSRLNMEINYQGFRIPAYVQYRIWDNKKLQLNTLLGMGVEYTYKLWFVPNNIYGNGPTQRRTAEIVAPFASGGINLCYKPSTESKVNYIISIFYETDAIFNPKRFNEYNFYQNAVPLLSHQLFSTLSIQFPL